MELGINIVGMENRRNQWKGVLKGDLSCKYVTRVDSLC